MLAAQSMQCLAEGLFTATYKFALLAVSAGAKIPKTPDEKSPPVS
jgi:hypothetical protein